MYSYERLDYIMQQTMGIFVLTEVYNQEVLDYLSLNGYEHTKAADGNVFTHKDMLDWDGWTRSTVKGFPRFNYVGVMY